MGIGNAEGIKRRRESAGARKRGAKAKRPLSQASGGGGRGKKKAKPRARPSSAKARKKTPSRKLSPAAERKQELESITVSACEYLSEEYPCESSVYRDRANDIDAEVTIRGPFDEDSGEDALQMLTDAIRWRGGRGYWVSVAFWINLQSEEMAQRYDGPLRGLAPVATHPTRDFGVGMLTARMNILPTLAEYKIARISVRFNWNPRGEQPERL